MYSIVFKLLKHIWRVSWYIYILFLLSPQGSGVWSSHCMSHWHMQHMSAWLTCLWEVSEISVVFFSLWVSVNITCMAFYLMVKDYILLKTILDVRQFDKWLLVSKWLTLDLMYTWELLLYFWPWRFLKNVSRYLYKVVIYCHLCDKFIVCHIDKHISGVNMTKILDCVQYICYLYFCCWHEVFSSYKCYVAWS